MVVGFTTTCAISAYHHESCEFESRSWWGVLYTLLGIKVFQASKFLLHLECCLLSPKRHIRISQCSPFLLNDRWLFFVADFYSVFSFFCRCAQVRVITLFFQFYASTCYSNFILFSTCLSYIYIILLSLVIYLSKRDFITIFFSKVLIFLLIPLLFQPGYVSF